MNSEATLNVSLTAFGGPWLAGLDEAGAGPLCGDLVVAAVVLDPARPIEGLADSKKLSPAKRARLHALVLERAAAWAVVRVSPADIDRLNIFQARMAGFTRAVDALAESGVHLATALIDGNKVPEPLKGRLGLTARAIVKGDATEAAISAASILAKVERDRAMDQAHERWPAYGFLNHKGYPTMAHYEALARLGLPTPALRAFYRTSYRGVPTA